MRATFAFIAALSAGIALPASAQDLAVTQIVQRVCIPSVTGRSWDRSTWAAVDVGVQALGLTLNDYSERWGRTWSYSLVQPAGTYSIQIQADTSGVRCYVDAPDGVSRAQLERAVAQALGREWSTGHENGRPVWTQTVAPSGGFVGHDLKLAAGALNDGLVQPGSRFD